MRKKKVMGKKKGKEAASLISPLRSFLIQVVVSFPFVPLLCNRNIFLKTASCYFFKTYFRFTYEIAPVFVVMEEMLLKKMHEMVGWGETEADGIFSPGK